MAWFTGPDDENRMVKTSDNPSEREHAEAWVSAAPGKAPLVCIVRVRIAPLTLTSPISRQCSQITQPAFHGGGPGCRLHWEPVIPHTYHIRAMFGASAEVEWGSWEQVLTAHP